MKKSEEKENMYKMIINYSIIKINISVMREIIKQ